MKKTKKRIPSLGQIAVKEANLLRALMSLGDTPEEVAGNLKKLNVVGQRCESTDCPIANYLKVKTNIEKVLVGSDDARVGTIWFNLPSPIEAFVMEFDDGRFFFLERT